MRRHFVYLCLCSVTLELVSLYSVLKPVWFTHWTFINRIFSSGSPASWVTAAERDDVIINVFSCHVAYRISRLFSWITRTEILSVKWAKASFCSCSTLCCHVGSINHIYVCLSSTLCFWGLNHREPGITRLANSQLDPRDPVKLSASQTGFVLTKARATISCRHALFRINSR